MIRRNSPGPWAGGLTASEGRIYAKYLMKEKPNGKIGILYQNDDFGKDVLKGLKDGLGAKGASMIIAEEPYETSVPTVNSQIVALKSKGADVFVSITTPKFGAQSVKKVAELGWKPLFILNNVASSTGSVIKPAGYENAQGVISATYGKDPTNPRWKDDAGVKNFDAYRQVLPGSQPRRQLGRLRLQFGTDAGACAQGGG